MQSNNEKTEFAIEKPYSPLRLYLHDPREVALRWPV
jgi:hypothetical protein